MILSTVMDEAEFLSAGEAIDSSDRNSVSIETGGTVHSSHSD